MKRLFFFFFFPAVLFASEDYTIVVKEGRDAGDDSSSHSVVTARDMEQQQTATVSDAAKMMAGLSVTDDGGGSFFSVRGLRSRNLLVLLDGVPLVSPLSVDGSYDMRGLSTLRLASITLLKGPHAVLYGAGAMGGVLLLKTKKSGHGFQGEARLFGASVSAVDNSMKPNAAHGSLTLSYGTKRFVVSGGSYFSYDNALSDASQYGDYVSIPALNGLIPEKDKQVRGGGSFLFRYKLSDGADFRVYSAFRSDNSDTDDGAGPLLDDPNRVVKRTEFLCAPTLLFPLGKTWDTTLSFAVLASVLEDTDGEDPGKVYEDTYSSYNGFRLTADWKNSVSTKKTVTKFGVGLVRSWGTAVFTDNSTFRLMDLSFTGQHNTRLSLWGHLTWKPLRSLSFIAGLRGEGMFYQTQTIDRQTGELLPEQMHRQFEPLVSVGVVWDTPFSSKFRARGGRAFRSPTLFELYSPYAPKYDALQPETAWGVDGGYTHYVFHKKIALASTLFWERVYNQIDMNKQNVFENRAMTENAGLECTVRTKSLHGLSGSFAWTWLFWKNEYRYVVYNSTRYKKDVPLLRRPDHTISLSLNWNWKKRLNVNFRLLWRGSVQDTIFLPPKNPYIETIPSFVTADIALSWNVHRLVTVYARVENFTNTQYSYSAGYSTGGITPSFGISIKMTGIRKQRTQ